ncbi:MAG: M23 family metallopeptidase [Longimicrobiales bacterium]
MTIGTTIDDHVVPHARLFASAKKLMHLTAASLATGALLVAAPVAAQVPAASVVSFEPASPVQGTLFVIILTSPVNDVASASGTAAGEPLHFQREDDGRFTALAAAPLDGGSKVDVRVTLVRANGNSEPVSATVPVAVGNYALDRLSVAPRFGTPAGAATQARIDRERQRALGVSQRSHETPRLWQNVVQPRDSRITSGFGNGREFNGTVQSRHTGTDFAGAVGAEVRAAARGIVALVDTFYLAGNVVYLDHGHGLVTAYFHLSETLVKEGETVAAGHSIGRVGATGRVTGPHLHWVVRYGAISVDPMSLLALARR